MDSENVPKIILLFSKYFWAIAILVSCINAVMVGSYMKTSATIDRVKMMLAAALWLNVPWIVMGIGSTIGGVPSVWYYFRPRDGNPYVLAWWATILILYAISSYWVFIGNGASKLAKLEIIRCYGLGKTITICNETAVKIIFLLMLSGGIIAAAIMWFVNIPLPPFAN